MQYGLTKSVIERSKLKAIPVGTEMDLRFVWEVNYASICGKKLLIIVHADTRYSLIFSDMKPSVWKDLKNFIHQSVANALYMEHFTGDEVERYFEIAGEELLTKTHGRKVIGGLNHLTSMLSYYPKILVEGMYQPMITETANDDLVTLAVHPEENYICPKEYFIKRISELLKE